MHVDSFLVIGKNIDEELEDEIIIESGKLGKSDHTNKLLKI